MRICISNKFPGDAAAAADPWKSGDTIWYQLNAVDARPDFSFSRHNFLFFKFLFVNF